MKNRLIFFVAVLVTFAVNSGSAQTPHKKADALISAFMAKWEIPGGSFSITKNAESLYENGLGFADHNKNRPALVDDQYRIASVSKPITAIAVMKLVEAGKLKLSDTIFGKDKLLHDPYYLNVISDQRIYNITVVQLLEHTAGWNRNASYNGIANFDPPFFPLYISELEHAPNPIGDSTLIRFSLSMGLNTSPGKSFSYSNVGYLILGKVIAVASGMPYEDFVKKELFESQGIFSISLGKNLHNAKGKNETDYYSDEIALSCYGDGKKVDCAYGGFNLEAMNAHGGWIASAKDLTKLILATDGFDNSTDILTKNSIERMTSGSSVNPYYAKGWSVNPTKNNWYHTGSLPGTATFICRTNSGYTWAFLFNARGNNSAAFWREFDQLPGKVIQALEENQDQPKG